MDKEETKKFSEKNKHIATDVIKQDISDTQKEIVEMWKEITFLESTPVGMKDARWNHMRADTRKAGIKDREEFIKALEGILEFRSNQK